MGRALPGSNDADRAPRAGRAGGAHAGAREGRHDGVGPGNDTGSAVPADGRSRADTGPAHGGGTERPRPLRRPPVQRVLLPPLVHGRAPLTASDPVATPRPD